MDLREPHDAFVSAEVEPAQNVRRVRSWKARLGLGLLGVVGLAILAGIAIELGPKWHWERVKRNELARGRLATVESLAPPPVADAENFAAIPLLQQPPPAPPPDEPGAPRRNSEFDLRPLKAKRLALPFWIDDWMVADLADCLRATRLGPSLPGESPAATILRGLAPLEGGLQELAEGAERPFCRFPSGAKNSGTSPMLGEAAQVFALRVAARVATGDSAGAAEDILSMLRMGRLLRQDPAVLQQMTGELISSLSFAHIWRGSVSRLWTVGQLTAFEHELAQIDLFRNLKTSLQSELAGLAASQEKACDSDAPYIAILHPGFARLSWSAGCFMGLAGAISAGSEFLDSLPARRPDRFGKGGEGRLPWPKSFDGISTEDFLLGLRMRELETARNQMKLELALAGVRLERERLARGRYPESTDKLQLRNDLVLGEPIHYEVSQDGSRFRLKGIGWVREKGQIIGSPTAERVWVYYSNAGGEAGWR